MYFSPGRSSGLLSLLGATGIIKVDERWARRETVSGGDGGKLGTCTQWGTQRTRPSGVRCCPLGCRKSYTALKYWGDEVSIHKRKRALPTPTSGSLKTKREGKQHLLKWLKCANDHATCFILFIQPYKVGTITPFKDDLKLKRTSSK